MTIRQHICVLHLGCSTLGIEVHRVQEVLRSQMMARTPLAGHPVLGLINLRGQIVTAIDLRMRLGMEPSREATPSMMVVLDTHEDFVSLLVDAVGDVINIDSERCQPPPETLPSLQRAMLCGSYSLEDRLLLMLNVDRIVDACIAS